LWTERNKIFLIKKKKKLLDFYKKKNLNTILIRDSKTEIIWKIIQATTNQNSTTDKPSAMDIEVTKESDTDIDTLDYSITESEIVDDNDNIKEEKNTLVNEIAYFILKILMAK